MKIRDSRKSDRFWAENGIVDREDLGIYEKMGSPVPARQSNKPLLSIHSDRCKKNRLQPQESLPGSKNIGGQKAYWYTTQIVSDR